MTPLLAFAGHTAMRETTGVDKEAPPKTSDRGLNADAANSCSAK